MAESSQSKKKPQKMNGFSMFMMENRKKWEEEGQTFPAGLRDVAQYADPLWRDMTEEERAYYKDKAVAKNSAEPTKAATGRPPAPSTLGFRGPPLPCNVLELAKRGVGVAPDYPQPDPVQNANNNRGQGRNEDANSDDEDEDRDN